ncbi:hypothetical protein D9615_009793 [Tricholomella constricta]|uniref:Beach-domain-containing protein n=1 Tax=Tricholomella constricta TaxID=117010 RepID=A0A8H5LVC5_9AGAR|nr:hypothetical protein D9615_009793 [Tricholomella constricta]
MLRTLLTPLRARFDLSPKTPTAPLPPTLDEDETTPEDFARDVIIELMRNSVENLKLAEDTRTKNQVLAEIHRMLLQDAHTKDVFRELDGFLILMSLLSNIQDRTSSLVVEPEEQVLSEVLKGTRLIFTNLSEAMSDHAENAEYFRNVVGYGSLEDALRGLVGNPKTIDHTLGLILSLAINNFDASNIFSSFRATPEDELEFAIAGIEARLGIIRRPGAILILWNAIPQITAGDDSMRYAILKLFELLSHVSHRNQAILSTLGLVKSLFQRYYATRNDPTVPEKERYILQKLLRRLLDMGATTSEARLIFQKAIKEDRTLDTEILDVIRFGIKSRWLEHFSMESPAALVLHEEGLRGVPVTGFTFMIWLWISALPPATPHPLFTVKLSSKSILTLTLHPNGCVQLSTSGNHDPAVFSSAKLHKFRWTHLTLVHYPHRASSPTIRFFVDGVLSDTLHWTYPKAEPAQSGSYIIGDASSTAQMSWCIASAYLLTHPLGDDLPRLIHHLGPRYAGNFQDPALVKFLTYEASTSLNMFLSTVAAKQPSSLTQSAVMKAVKDGLGINESAIGFAVSPLNARQSGPTTSVLMKGFAREFKNEGDVFVVKAACLDTALWKIGGAAVALRLVQVANTQHEISRSLGVLTDGLRNSWQNSEDMERLRGYEILADILRGKAQMINVTGFETLFEFLGLNFRFPEQSTIVNTVAYRAIALDFELWSRARKEIQQVYLEHFTTVLQTSRYRRFNSRQKFAKLGLVRKLLFVLQTDWFQNDMIPYVMDALKAATQAQFSKDDTIKPIVAYLAANLHEDSKGASSPHSIISRIDYTNPQEKAEPVLDMLISTLSIPSYHAKFAAALPLTRICLLLLGDRPSPAVATQILTLIGVSNTISSSFSRKFELISGWNVLKTVIPYCWDPRVNQTAFDILLGRFNHIKKSPVQTLNTVVCPNIVPAILSVLQTGLISVANNCSVSDEIDSSSGQFSWSTESNMENLVEEIMDLHALSTTFRQVFKSQQTTQLFVDGYKTFVTKVTAAQRVNQWTRRILEKISHLGLALALDPVIAGNQKREILDTLQKADTVLNPSAEKLSIDPSLIVDTRSVRQRIASARFSMQVGERTIIKTVARMTEWRKTIQISERKRLRKTVLDLRETRRQISALYEWTHLLTSERGLWPDQSTRLWRLDETEGPYRIRKKLEPQNDKAPNSRVDTNDENIRHVQAPDIDTTSMHQVEVPPWAETYEISATEMDDRQLAEEISEDKHRRVRHELEPGDVIEAVGTVARIAGVDSSPGLLIIGRTHLYMLDGLVENDEGEVVEAHDAPKRLFFVPGSIVELDGPQRAQRWSHEQVATFSEKTCLFRDVALEIYFKDSRSLLFVFLDKKKRSEIDQRLASIIGKHSPEASLTPGLRKTPLLGLMGSRALSGFRTDELYTAQRKWQAREISNFTYLSILNQISGRTPSDATQYPVFPWVLKDYSSQILDLHSPDSFRDLTKPMGALTPARREAAETRYVNLKSVEEEPFHYGTHFSSSMIVCHFLIRLAPYTNMFKTLQGGEWDLPDRLFSDLPRAYDSAAQDVRGDVRELIPEFFTCPEDVIYLVFLENSANLDFGVQQNTGERIHDVKLPPWARDDPLLFIVLNRRALESSIVSENLPAWIDLIWGCKQRDPEALNVFHPLSYEGSIDLDTITDELEREATVGIIHNFGQTPRKLFTTPHPERFNHGLSTLPVGVLHGIEEDAHLLVQASRCFKDLGENTPVRVLALDVIGEKIIPCPEGVLCAPLHPHEQVEWRTGGNELRLVVDSKVVQVVENAFCNCADFADSSSLVTGSSDYTVRLWKISRGNAGSSSTATGIVLSHIMRIHTDEVTCITASRTWSLVLSGSKDGSAALWDLNKGVYVRSIWHGDGGESTAVNLVAINESTGYIATCSRSKLCLHTINARPMATLDLTTTPSFSTLVPTITAMEFHEREYSHLGVLATGGPDGSITLRTWTADGTPEGQKAQWEFVTIRTMKARMVGRGVTRPPSVTSLKFLGETLVHGEETGKAYMWNLPD